MPEPQAYLHVGLRVRAVSSVRFPVNFPVSREFDLETGSLETGPSASATVQVVDTGLVVKVDP